MKKLWTVIASVAVANVLAIVALLAWLKTSDRLSDERVQLLKTTFSKTIASEKQEKAAAAAAMEEEKKKKAQEEKMARPPETASEKIEKQSIEEEQKLQIIQRKQQELDNLRTTLITELSKLESREKKLAEEKAAFAAERARIAETEGAKQFRDALATLEGQKPKDAKGVLKALIEAKNKDQAVSYLAKMEEGKRSKVIAEFVKDDTALAAELLESLRTRGTIVPPADTRNADQRPATPATPPASTEPAQAGAGPAPTGAENPGSTASGR